MRTVRLKRLNNHALFGGCLILLAIAYYFAARLGLGFRFQNSQIGVVWPANGLFLAALLLTSKRRWWIVLVTTAIVHMIVMYPLVPAWRWTWQIVGNSVFVVTTALLIGRFSGVPLHLGNRRQVFAYTTLSFALPSAWGFLTPAFVRSLFGLESFGPWAALLRTTLSNASALLLITPFVTLGVQYGLRRSKELPRRRIIEAVLMMTMLLAVGVAAFGAGPQTARVPGILLWMVPPLLWGAVRFGPMGASASMFSVAALSIWGTARQLGPFIFIEHVNQVLSLQMFWIVLSVPLMLLAAVIREREQMEHALHELRNQLAHVTRMATVGELSGAIAHELRQPLTSILANAQAGVRLIEKPQYLGEVREILNDIVEQDLHAAKIISGLQSFLKKGESNLQSVPVETLVRDALSLSRSTIAISAVQLQSEFIAGPAQVRGDPIQLLQVLLNLIVNACDAMKSQPVAGRQLRVYVGMVAPEQIRVSITDSGSGLPSGHEYEVFEPFFTTKDKGLGLGLTIARSIARSHGGRLWGENNAQGGATLHLELPRESVHSPTVAEIPLAKKPTRDQARARELQPSNIAE